MSISNFLEQLVLGLSEENYDQTLSDYRFWMKIGAAHGWIPSHQLSNDIAASTKPHLVDPFRGQLIHSTSHLLLQFITDVGRDPVLSTYASGAHEQRCHRSLSNFLANNLDFIPRNNNMSWAELRSFYTNANFLAHWANLGYLDVEDIKYHILQSLTFQPTVHSYQLNSLGIFLKISGATFAAHVDPSVMDRCCDILKSADLGDSYVAAELVKVRILIQTVRKNHER